MRETFKEWYDMETVKLVAKYADNPSSPDEQDIWQAACKWMQEEQIQRDAEICDKNTKKFPACICAELIRNQDKGDL